MYSIYDSWPEIAKNTYYSDLEKGWKEQNEYESVIYECFVIDEVVGYVTASMNKIGEKIKVVIISMTGSEGIDFKNLRQLHILEPWYNLSLIEQIIGRAVRNCSHKNLPFSKRNVEIFLWYIIYKFR